MRLVLLGACGLLISCQLFLHSAGGALGATAGSLGGPATAAGGAVAGVAAGELVYDEYFDETREDDDEATVGELRGALEAIGHAKSGAERALRLAIVAGSVALLGMFFGWWGNSKNKKYIKEVKDGQGNN
jgi:hypothetical protein